MKTKKSSQLLIFSFALAVILFAQPLTAISENYPTSYGQSDDYVVGPNNDELLFFQGLFGEEETPGNVGDYPDEPKINPLILGLAFLLIILLLLFAIWWYRKRKKKN